MERRYFSVAMRAAGEDDKNTLTGYAAIFNELSQVLFGMFRERIVRGAFAGSLGDDIRALWNHNTDYPLGRSKNNTLRLFEDAHGLRVEIDPPATTIGRDAVESIRRGDVDQMSFAFDVLTDDWEQDNAGVLIRTLTSVKLHEVSPVTFPAYTQTAIGVRGISDMGDLPVIPTRFRRDEVRGGAELAQARTVTRRRRLSTIL